MPDVGVLQLSIQDNSSQAAEGLNKLVSVLESIKGAVNIGSKMGTVARSIEKLAKSVNENLTGSTISKLNELCHAFENLQGIGAINIRISNGKDGSVTDSFYTLQHQVETAQEISERMQNITQNYGEAIAPKNIVDVTDSMNEMRQTVSEMQNTNLNNVKNNVEDIGQTITAIIPYNENLENSWERISERMSEAKRKAQEIEAIRLKQEEKFYSDSGPSGYSMEQTNKMADNLTQLDLLKQKLHEAEIQFNKFVNDLGMESTKTIKAGLLVSDLRDKIWEYTNSLKEASKTTTSNGVTNVSEFTDMSQIDLMTMKMQGMQETLAEDIANNRLDSQQIAERAMQIQNVNQQIEELRQQEEDACNATHSLRSAFDSLREGIKNLTFSKLLKQFARIAKYRVIRSVLKHITAGFSEGVENVYQYSKAVGTDLAPAMDQAATSLQQMKNSIGAAVAPVIQALVPVLQNVVNWFINLINYANQFFALLNGQSTWTRALPEQAEAYEKTSKSAKNASKAMKDLLADWDELNIIQNESGSGAGSGTGKTAEEYKNMFEEVSEFNDGVKNALDFIRDQLGGLPGILKKAGLILLGWKFSKAFSGFLGSLGELIAGGALLVLGVELSYGSGFSAGSKGSFDSGDIIGTIGGALATAIGGSLITSGLGLGGGIGFAIGIGVAVIATLTGWIKGQADFMDKMKWGDKEMTPDQIKEYIRSKFTFNIDAEITLLDSNIQNKEEAEADLTKTVNDFTSSLTFAKLQVGIEAADSVDALTDAYLSANEVIKSIQTYIDKTEKALAVTMSVSPIQDKNGNDITEELLKEVGIADTTLKDYFTELGKQLADAMYEGEKDGWTQGEMEAVLALMEHQRNIVARAEEMQRDITFEMNYKFNLNNLTRDNAKEIIAEETALINEYKEKFMKDRETAKEAAIKELAWTEAAIEDYKKQGRDTSELESAAATYQKLIQEYADPEKAEAAWKLKMEESMANMREDWIEALKGNYGILDREFTEQRNPLLFTSVNSELTNAVYDAAKGKDPVGEATKALKTYFDEIKKQQPDYIQEMMDSLNLSVWDIADDEIKKNLANVLRNALGDDYAAMVLQSIIPIDEIEKLFGENYKFDPGKISPEGIKDNKWERPWWDILGLKYEPPEDEGFVVQAEPKVEFKLNERQVMTDLKNKIESALSDGQLDFTERTALELTFGKEAVTQILDELEYVLDEEGYSTGRLNPKNFVASTTGAHGRYTPSGDAYSPYFVYPNQNTTNESATNEVDFTKAVETGTTNANRDQNDILNSIMRGVEALLRKEWTVNVSPSSNWGNSNAKSADAWNMVTGS